jgi:hypothetical protein
MQCVSTHFSSQTVTLAPALQVQVFQSPALESRAMLGAVAHRLVQKRLDALKRSAGDDAALPFLHGWKTSTPVSAKSPRI